MSHEEEEEDASALGHHEPGPCNKGGINCSILREKWGKGEGSFQVFRGLGTPTIKGGPESHLLQRHIWCEEGGCSLGGGTLEMPGWRAVPQVVL